MAYLIYALDFDHMHSIREKIRNVHRDYLRSIGKKLLASGALLDEDGATIVGGMSLVDMNNYSEAEEFAFQDPYHKAGIRKDVKIFKWRRRWWCGEFLEDEQWK